VVEGEEGVVVLLVQVQLRQRCLLVAQVVVEEEVEDLRVVLLDLGLTDSRLRLREPIMADVGRKS